MKNALLSMVLAFPVAGMTQSADTPASTQTAVHSEFRVRYVSEGSVYIDGGRDAGLTEGTKLILK